MHDVFRSSLHVLFGSVGNLLFSLPSRKAVRLYTSLAEPSRHLLPRSEALLQMGKVEHQKVLQVRAVRQSPLLQRVKMGIH